MGHFDYGIKQLNQSGLRQKLEEKVFEDKIPILGICLGAQLLTKRSDEGKEDGLGWIDGETVAFERDRLSSNLRVPHMGWADVRPQGQHPLFDGLEENSRFYFVHSFHMRVEHVSTELVTANHGYDFCAGVQKDNILGVQFHPEKSHRYGMTLLKNFAEKC